MEPLLYIFARGFIALLQSLSLPNAARLGRVGGGFAYWLDVRHRRVTLSNLTLAFGAEKSRTEIHALAREIFRRIGENYCCAIKTAAMAPEELRPHCKFIGIEKLPPPPGDMKPQSIVVAIGHFGNFELYARFGQFWTDYQCVTTYRALREPSLNRLMQSLRERSGCIFYERRTDGATLKATMNKPGIMLGLLADQRTGKNGLMLPFMGHECLTSAAPAVFALRYRCPLHTGICYRIGPARWELILGEQIPTQDNGSPRSVEAIMRDVNLAFDAAVRRDPANWFWVHDRWKPPRKAK